LLKWHFYNEVVLSTPTDALFSKFKIVANATEEKVISQWMIFTANKETSHISSSSSSSKSLKNWASFIANR